MACFGTPSRVGMMQYMTEQQRPKLYRRPGAWLGMGSSASSVRTVQKRRIAQLTAVSSGDVGHRTQERTNSSLGLHATLPQELVGAKGRRGGPILALLEDEPATMYEVRHGPEEGSVLSQLFKDERSGKSGGLLEDQIEEMEGKKGATFDATDAARALKRMQQAGRQKATQEKDKLGGSLKKGRVLSIKGTSHDRDKQQHEDEGVEPKLNVTPLLSDGSATLGAPAGFLLSTCGSVSELGGSAPMVSEDERGDGEYDSFGESGVGATEPTPSGAGERRLSLADSVDAELAGRLEQTVRRMNKMSQKHIRSLYKRFVNVCDEKKEVMKERNEALEKVEELEAQLRARDAQLSELDHVMSEKSNAMSKIKVREKFMQEKVSILERNVSRLDIALEDSRYQEQVSAAKAAVEKAAADVRAGHCRCEEHVRSKDVVRRVRQEDEVLHKAVVEALVAHNAADTARMLKRCGLFERAATTAERSAERVEERLASVREQHRLTVVAMERELADLRRFCDVQLQARATVAAERERHENSNGAVSGSTRPLRRKARQRMVTIV